MKLITPADVGRRFINNGGRRCTIDFVARPATCPDPVAVYVEGDNASDCETIYLTTSLTLFHDETRSSYDIARWIDVEVEG
jgi:hypothetical protein